MSDQATDPLKDIPAVDHSDYLFGKEHSNCLGRAYRDLLRYYTAVDHYSLASYVRKCAEHIAWQQQQIAAKDAEISNLHSGYGHKIASLIEWCECRIDKAEQRIRSDPYEQSLHREAAVFQSVADEISRRFVAPKS